MESKIKTAVQSLFTHIDAQEPNLNIPPLEVFNAFKEGTKYENFSQIKDIRNNTFEFKVHKKDNDQSNFTNKFLSAGVKRQTQSISKSEDTYNYTVGSYYSIKVGKSHSYISLPDSKKRSVNMGKTIAMNVGNTKSVSNVTTEASSYIKADSYNIKDISNKVSVHNDLDLYFSTTTLLTQFVKTSSILETKYHLSPFRFDFTVIPIKGHFTALQQIVSLVYGDFVHYENLARIVGTTFTMFNQTATADYNTLVYKNADLYVNQIKDEIILRDIRRNRDRKKAAVAKVGAVPKKVGAVPKVGAVATYVSKTGVLENSKVNISIEVSQIIDTNSGDGFNLSSSPKSQETIKTQEIQTSK